MGAVTFSLDTRLVEHLKGVLRMSVFVETGTFKGDTVASVAQYFSRLVTIESSLPLWKDAVVRFEGNAHIEAYLGHSPEILTKFQPRFSLDSCLFWLDAHWCVAENTAGDCSQCPLLDEILAIGRLGCDSVVLIDDARLFLAPPLAPHDISQWPTFDQIITALRKLSDLHELMVINDVIAYYPKNISGVMYAYAQKFGVDWLAAYSGLDSHNNLLRSLEEKERLIQSQHTLLQQQLNELEEKNRRLEEMRVVSFIFRPVTRPLMWIIRPIYRELKPKLGNLNQHPPHELSLPASYAKTPLLTATPKISIVTPSFKQAEFIEQTLVSVIDQSYPNLEFFVQDGGSEDGTTSVLDRFAEHLTGWESRVDNGQSHAINRGFSRTSGEIMAWLNSDDILLPGALAYVAEFFNCHPEVDVVYGHRILIDENNQQIGRWVMPAHDDQVLSWADFVPQETMFWRRRIWEKAGGQIDESFHFAIDWDLLVRFRQAGACFARLPRFLGGFRIHPQQKTSAAISEIGVQEMGRIRQRMLGRIPSQREINKAIFPYLLRHVVSDFGWRLRSKLALR